MEITRDQNVASYCMVPLIDAANRPDYKASPTLTAGDVKIIRHTGAAWNEANIGTLPAVIGGTNKQVLVTLTAAELNPDDNKYPITVQFVDQTVPKEWDDQTIIIWTRPVVSDVQEIGSDAQSAVDLKDFVDAGYDPATNKVEGVKLVDTTTANTDMVGTDDAALASALSTHDGKLDTVDTVVDAIKAVTDVLPNSGALTDIDTGINNIEAKLPTNYIMGSSVQTDKDDEIDAIKVVTDNLPNSGSLTDIDTGINTIEAKLPSKAYLTGSDNADGDVELDGATGALPAGAFTNHPTVGLNDDAITASKFDETTAYPLKSDDSGSTAVARTGADGDTLETLSDQIDGVQTSVDGIQNNTKFVATVPTNMLVPDAGTTMYKITTHFYDNDGNMEDPDNNEIDILYEDVSGADKDAFFDDAGGITGATAGTIDANMWKMVKISTGVYETYYKLPNTETVDQWTASFKLEEASSLLNYSRSTNVVEENPGSTTLADNTTNKDIIAEAMKERDVSGTGAVSGSIHKDIMDNIDANEAKIDTIDTAVDAIKVVTDALPNAGALTDIDTGVNAIEAKLPTNYIMGSSDQTDKDDEIDSIKVTVEALNNLSSGDVQTACDSAITANTDINNIDSGVNNVEAKLPTNYIMGSSVQSDKDDEIDAIKAVTDVLPNAGALTDIDTGINNIEAKLPSKAYLTGSDNLSGDVELDDATGALPSGAFTNHPDVDLNADQSGVTVGTVNALGAQAKLDVNAECDTALSDIGLDHLVQVAVTGVDVTDDSIIAQMVSKSATADWDTFDNTTDSLEGISDGGGTSLTSQQVRDAMKLAPTVGAPAAGSIDEHLDDILVDTGTTLDGKINTIDTVVDAIKVVTDLLPNSGALTDIDTGINNIESDIGTPVALDSGAATLSGMLTKMADDNGGADFDATSDSLHALQGTIVAGIPGNIVANAQNVTNGTVDSGSYVDTQVQDGTYFQLSPDGASLLDVDLTYDLDTSGPISVTIHGRYDSIPGQYAEVYAWNYDGAAWEKISSSDSQMNHSATNQDYNYVLLNRHKDPITGNVKIRFLSSRINAGDNLYLDAVLVKSVVAGATPAEIADAVYLKMKYTVYTGAIYIDTNNGTAGIDVGVHGIPSNPVDTLADAITLASSVGVRKFVLIPGSSISLSQGFPEWEFEGYEATIALNGQDISQSTFRGGLTMSGVATAPTGAPAFVGCDMGISTIPACVMKECQISNDLTLGTASGDYYADGCFSGVAGTATPSVTFAANANFSMRHYSGGIEVKSMAAGASMSLEGDGQLVINASCTGGTIAIRGAFKVTDNASGAVTLSDEARYATDQLDQSLVDIGLDHLVSVAVTGADVTDDSIIANIVSKAATPDWDTFDNTTDALEANTDLLTTVDGKVDTIDTVVDGIKAVTDLLPNSGALTDIDTGVNNIEAKLPTNYIMGSGVQTDKDDEIDAIKAVTDLLPNGGAFTDIDTGVNNIEAKLPSKSYLTGSDNSDGDIELDDATGALPAGAFTNHPAVDLNDDAITASKFDETTAYPITAIDSGSTAVARVGADGDTLESLSDQIDGVQTSVDGIQNNTRFVATVPNTLIIPIAGTTMYKISAHFYDSDGNMEDPDNNEIDVLYEDVSGIDKDAFFDDAAGSTPATAGVIDTNMWKMVKISTGVYETYYKLPSTESAEQWTASFKLEESTALLQYSRSSNVLAFAPGSTTLADNTTNKDIIAEALKERDVSGTGAVSGSIYKDINDNIDASEVKIDTIDTVVDAIKVVTDALPNAGALTDIDTGINNIEAKLPTNYIMGSGDQSDKDDEIDAIKAVTDVIPNGGALTDIDTGINNIEAKLPTNYIMGSSVQTAKDDEIDAIKTVTDLLPNGGALTDIDTGINNIEAKLPSGTISDFDESADQVTVATNNDKTGYSISGTKQTLDALNDVSSADVNAEVDTALSDIGLDHLISAAVTGADVTDDSIIANMVSKAATPDWDTFDNTTDSLEAIADAAGGGTVDANIVSIDGALTNGNNAILNLKQLNIQSDANLPAVVVAGSGSGAGIDVAGGENSDGVKIAGGSTSGDGIAISTIGGHGIDIDPGGNGDHGINIAATGGSGSMGIRINATGPAINMTSQNVGMVVGGGVYFAGGTDKPGLNIVGNGTASGLKITGGSTGHGVDISGGSTSGDGIKVSTTDGHGIELVPTLGDGINISPVAGTGVNILSGTGGDGLRVTAQSNRRAVSLIGGATSSTVLNIEAPGTNSRAIDIMAADGHAVSMIGGGVGNGLRIDGGATGDGLKVVGGSTSGKGINIETTDGIAFDMTAGGANKDIDATEIDNIQTAVDALNDLSSADVQTACDAAITANTDINNIDAGVDNIEAKLPSKSYLAGSNNADGDVELDEATGAFAGGAYTNHPDVDLNADQSAVTIGTVDALGAQAKLDVNAECDTALSDIGLDHLVQVAVTGADVTDDSIIANMVSKAVTPDWDTFDNTTDSLEGIADGAGGTALTAQEVRDAMKLAPTGGAPAADSVDDHLDNIITDVGVVDTTVDAIKVVTDAIPNAGALNDLSTGDILGMTVDGAATFDTAMKQILAYCGGDINRVGDVYTYRNYDDSSSIMVLTGSAAGRVRT